MAEILHFTLSGEDYRFPGEYIILSDCDPESEQNEENLEPREGFKLDSRTGVEYLPVSLPTNRPLVALPD